MKFTANPPGVDAPVVDGGSTLVKDRRSPFLSISKEGRHWIHISIVFSIPYNDENEVVLEFKTSRKLLSWWNQSCFWAHTSVSEPNARHTPTSQQGNSACLQPTATSTPPQYARFSHYAWLQVCTGRSLHCQVENHERTKEIYFF